MHGQSTQHFRSSKPKGYAPRGTQGNFGETIYRRGVGKMACWNSNMSESVNTEEKGL